MRGLVGYEGERGKRTLGGVVFLLVPVRRGEGVLARMSARRAARYLQRRGVREAVFPADYTYRDLFTARGILPPDPLPLQLGTAEEITRAALRKYPVRRIVVVGERVTADLRRTVCALRQDVRYFAADLGSGEETLAGELRRMYGLALECGLCAKNCRPDDLVLLFSPCPGWEEIPCRRIDLYRADLGVEYALPEKFRVEEADPKQLAAALYNAGSFGGENLRVLHFAPVGEEKKLALQMP